MSRERQIIGVSIKNIVGNVALAGAKGVVGVTTGSIAIALDAINSLADAMTAVIAIIGTKWAAKSANRDHPFGYGRMEYLTSILIAAIILAIGISSFVESVRSIIHPTTPQYSVMALVVVAVAAAVKFGLGIYTKRAGTRLSSGSLIGSGMDALMDGCVSTATCLAGVLYLTFGIAIESYLAAVISLLIVKSGTELLVDTSSKLLGERVSPSVAEKVERAAREVDEVRLASSLVLLDFGPNSTGGAIHVTVDGQMTIAEFDRVARDVQERVYETCGVRLAGVTPYPDATADDDMHEIRSTIGSIVWRQDHVVELRGLYVDPIAHVARFDAIFEFGTDDPKKLRKQIVESCEAEYPGWTFEARVLPDVAD